MEKNNFFITYTGVVEFIGKKTKGESKRTGDEYWTRTFAVNLNDTNPKYPVTLVFDLFGKKMELVDGYSVGEEVVVKFTINSKSYVNKEGETKYFMSLNLIEVKNGAGNQTTGAPDLGGDDESGLPF